MRLRASTIRTEAAVAVAAVLLCAPSMFAQKWRDLAEPGALPANQRPAQLVGVDVAERLNQQVDLDLEFIAENGYPVKLRDYFSKGKPVILDLVYYNCPMLCTLILNGQVEAMRDVPWTPGNEYEVVTISINPEEGYDVAKKKKQIYLASYDRPASGWHFLVDKGGNAKRLADMVGYHYKYDPQVGQYAHPSVIMVLTPEGQVARYLYGVRYKASDLRFALAEASEGRSTMALEKFLLLCYHYDPKSHAYVLFAQNFMRAGGILTVTLIGLFLFSMFRKERARAAARLREPLKAPFKEGLA
ncbi:MAG: SCO family protein [Bryobacteraceae bacterium]